MQCALSIVCSQSLSAFLVCIIIVYNRTGNDWPLDTVFAPFEFDKMWHENHHHDHKQEYARSIIQLRRHHKSSQRLCASHTIHLTMEIFAPF